MRLVEEEHEFGLRDVADLRQLLEKLGEEPHQHGREKLRLVLHRRQLEAGDDPAAVRRRPQQVGDLELRLAEELRAAAVLELDERPEQHADRRRRDAADALELLLALLRVEEGEERSQVREIEDRQALLSAYRKTSERLCSWVSFASSVFASRSGPKSDTVARIGIPGPIPPSERYSVGKPVGCQSWSSSFARVSAGPPVSPGCAIPETSPLMSAATTGTPAADSCSASS